MSWLADFIRPVNIIFMVLALLGIFLSWHFFNQSTKAGQIAIFVDQVQIFDKERLGQAPLRVLDASGNVITNNVYPYPVSTGLGRTG